MPIYSYRCKDCGAEFELLVGITQSSKKPKCKKCGSKNLKRLFSSFGVRMGSSSTGSSSCPTGTCPITGK